jgi:hypothetical protein
MSTKPRPVAPLTSALIKRGGPRIGDTLGLIQKRSRQRIGFLRMIYSDQLRLDLRFASTVGCVVFFFVLSFIA